MISKKGDADAAKWTESGIERVTFRLPTGDLRLLESCIDGKEFKSLSDVVRYALADLISLETPKPGHIKMRAALPRNDYTELEKIFGKDNVAKEIPMITNIYANEIYPTRREKFKQAMEYLKSKNA
jgi:Arc/MetJ-type ribon-helix-helix transcriptional regulator